MSDVTRALVLADTHLRPGRLDVPDRLLALADRADLVLHAGDVTDPSVLSRLAAFAPVRAVLGNNDHQLWGVLPERLELEVGGVPLAMVHDSGPAAGRARRLRRWFPDAAVVIFGHSHLPLDETAPDGLRLFNPGSAVERRRAPAKSCGWLEAAAGRIVRLGHIDLGP